MAKLHLGARDVEHLADLVTDYRNAVADNGEANEAAQEIAEWVDARLVRGRHLEPHGE